MMMKTEVDGIQYTESQLKGLRSRIIEVGQKNYQPFPWRNVEYKWQGLLAEVLLQRTRAKNVIPVYHKFLSKYKTPTEIGNASLSELESDLYSLGLKWRAKHLKKFGRFLSEAGEVPEDEGELIKIPGVGHYAANAFLAFHTNRKAVLIDSNIARFLCRLLGKDYDGETRRKKWVKEFLKQLVPIRTFKRFNIALLDFTMSICTPIKPKCTECPLHRTYCEYGKPENHSS
jgi:A/G-specific adenine glycosylase